MQGNCSGAVNKTPLQLPRLDVGGLRFMTLLPGKPQNVLEAMSLS